ncbi:MAG: hypothetical protein QMB63_06420 [Clostridiaceae bacterium]
MSERAKIKYIFQKRQREDSLTTDDLRRLRKEIRSYLRDLKEFHIDLQRLCRKKVSYEDRNRILNIALTLINNEEVADEFVLSAKLPVSKTAKITGYSTSDIEKYKEYIAAYMILLGTDKHSFLSRYLTIGTNFDKKNLGEYALSGIKLRDYGITSAVLTHQGNFKFLDTDKKNAGIGELVTGKDALIAPYKLRIFAVATMLAILGLIVFSLSFYRPSKTLFIMSEPKATFSYNSFERLIKYEGNNSAGKEVLNTTVFSDKKLDSSISEFIEESIKTKTISNGADITLIVLMGKFTPSDFNGKNLTDTVKKHNLTLRINLKDGNILLVTPSN